MVFFKRADLAITDLTITSGREQAVDFTSPFMNLGELFYITIRIASTFLLYKANN